MKWYEKTAWIWITLIFAFPLGCFLMWKYKKNWRKLIKIPLSIFLGFIYLSMLVGSSDANSTQITTLENRILELEDEQKNLIASEHDLNGQVESLLTDLASKETSITELQSEIESQKSALEDTKAIDDLKLKIDELETQAQILQAENDSLLTQLSNVEQQLASSSTKNTSKINNTSDKTAASTDANTTSQSTASEESANQTETAPQDTQASIVLITKTGSKYHRKKCGNGNYYESTLEDAKGRGLTACSKCF